MKQETFDQRWSNNQVGFKMYQDATQQGKTISPTVQKAFEIQQDLEKEKKSVGHSLTHNQMKLCCIHYTYKQAENHDFKDCIATFIKNEGDDNKKKIATIEKGLIKLSDNLKEKMKNSTPSDFVGIRLLRV